MNETEEDDDINNQKLDDNIETSQDGMPQNFNQNVPITDERNNVIADGQIPIDTQFLTTGQQVDALEPNGQVDLTFQSGNYQQLLSMPKVVQNKVQELTKTFVPLIEVALIELLGSSSMYKRETGQSDVIIENAQVFIDFTFKYIADMWIALDVDREAIESDANYVLQKLKTMQGVNLSSCTIDTTDGSLLVVGRI